MSPLDVLTPGSLPGLILTVLGAAAVILVFGTLLTREADRLADRTGLGEALFGAVALGAATSLAGSVMSVTVAYQGYPQLAVSNAVGGILAQTAFLVIADFTYRRANLEHAAASLENMLLGALLVVMLAFPLVAAAGPDWTVLGIHPVTVLLFAGYLFGLRVVRAARGDTPWRPVQTPLTREDEPEEHPAIGTLALWTRFLALVVVTALAGLVVAQAGIGLVREAGLRESLVGTYITAIVTSLPELVITLAAVRRGALTLAVSGIIGGNSFDVLFIAFSDVSYRGGSIYHAVGASEVFLLGVAILLSGVLLLGLLRRQRSGLAGIGFESLLVLALYGAASAVLFLV